MIFAQRFMSLSKRWAIFVKRWDKNRKCWGVIVKKLSRIIKI
jgi:hypothetical protein